MKLMPKWILTAGIPAYHDGESATCLEQTYKIYNAMNQLIEEYNGFVDSINKNITDFQNGIRQDHESFETAMRQEYQDFIDTIDLKIAEIETSLANTNAEFQTSVRNELTSMQRTLNNALSELETSIKAVTDALDSRITINETNIESNTNDIADIHSDLSYYKVIDSTLDAPINLYDLPGGFYILKQGCFVKTTGDHIFQAREDINVIITPSTNSTYYVIGNFKLVLGTSSGYEGELVRTNDYEIKEMSKTAFDIVNVGIIKKLKFTYNLQLNSDAGDGLSFYAPRTFGSSGQILQSLGINGAPVWVDPEDSTFMTKVNQAIDTAINGAIEGSY